MSEKKKLTREQKRLKYKKKFKKNYLNINRMHLREDPEELNQLIHTKPKKKKVQKKKDRKIPAKDLTKCEKVRQLDNIKGTGYVRLCFDYGNLNVELFCNKAPLTCLNFLTLAENGEYNKTSFHRLIKGFMVQGGKTSRGKSIWGFNFQNETVKGTKHSRGILSMANSGGTRSNSTQFYVCFGDAKWLDGKHTIFGRVVGGLNMLDIIEEFPTDEDDVPLEKIVLRKVVIYNNPFANV